MINYIVTCIHFCPCELEATIFANCSLTSPLQVVRRSITPNIVKDQKSLQPERRPARRTNTVASRSIVLRSRSQILKGRGVTGQCDKKLRRSGNTRSAALRLICILVSSARAYEAVTKLLSPLRGSALFPTSTRGLRHGLTAKPPLLRLRNRRSMAFVPP